MIKAVLFDIDGVLLDSFEANFAYYTDLLEKAGYPAFSEDEFKKATHFTLDGTIQFLTQTSSSGEVERIANIGRKYFEEFYRFDLLTMPQNAKKTIKELHKTYRLGIVTSRFKEAIYTMPSLLKLKIYFTVAVGFEDTIRHKPDPEPLLYAVHKLQIKPEESIYIGDAESDLFAATAAGTKFVLFGENNVIQADNYIDSFEKLPEIIVKL